MADCDSEQVRTYQLYKQGLVGNSYKTFSDVARASLGLHSTDYWTPYLSAWARIGDYASSDIFDTLNSGKEFVRMPAFRNTQHIIHKDNYAIVQNALGPRLVRTMRQAPPIKNLTQSEIDEKIREIELALQEGQLSIGELKKRLPHLGNQMRWLLLVGIGMGKIIRARGKHARSTRLTYDLAERWLKGFERSSMSEETALAEVTRRYIDHFGPVTIKDIAWWLSLRIGETKGIIAKIKDGLVEVEMDRQKLLMTNDDFDKFRAFELDERPEPFFLPYEDHFPKAYKIRSWYIIEEHTEMIFPKIRDDYWPPELKPPLSEPRKGIIVSGEIRPSIWVDGSIVGRWEIEKRDGQAEIVYGLFTDLSRDALDSIEQTRNELSEFVNRRLVPIS